MKGAGTHESASTWRIPVEFNDANFRSEVIESDRPVLVDVWAPWCGPCRAVGPAIEELAGQFEGEVKVGKLNVDENRKTAGDFEIRSIPTVLLFKHGTVVETLIGAQPKNRYEEVITNVAA